MFKNLFRLGYKRSWKEAVVFYFVYLLLGAILSGLLAVILAPLIFPKTQDQAQNFYNGLIVGRTFIMLFCPALSFLIIIKRKMFNLLSFVLASVSLPLAFMLGALLGVIPCAVLTALPGSSADAQKG